MLRSSCGLVLQSREVVPVCYVSGFAWMCLLIITCCIDITFGCAVVFQARKMQKRTEHWTLKVDVKRLLSTSSAEPTSAACLLHEWCAWRSVLLEACDCASPRIIAAFRLPQRGVPLRQKKRLLERQLCFTSSLVALTYLMLCCWCSHQRQGRCNKNRALDAENRC